MEEEGSLLKTTPKNPYTWTEIFKVVHEELNENLLGESEIFPNRPAFAVRKDALLQALRLLVEKFDARLLTITALDNGVDFELIYHIAVRGLVVNIKIFVAKEDSQVPSITEVVPGAISTEREIWDLFQIKFQGITDARAYIVPYEWRDSRSPLRKPLSGVVGSYQKPTVEKLMQTGQVLPITSSIIRGREQLRLPPMQTATARPEAVKEIQTIAREVGFDKKVGYDLERNKLRY